MRVCLCAANRCLLRAIWRAPESCSLDRDSPCSPGTQQSLGEPRLQDIMTPQSDSAESRGQSQELGEDTGEGFAEERMS